MAGICVCVIFNHRFDKNIDIIRKVYKNRFSNVYLLIPYYEGEDEGIINVSNSSYYFQGYVPTAYSKLKDKKFSHYVFIADDILLNPKINEDNILNYFAARDSAYIEEAIPLAEMGFNWWANMLNGINVFNDRRMSMWPVFKNIYLPEQAFKHNIYSSNYTELTLKNIKKHTSKMNLKLVINSFKFLHKLEPHVLIKMVKCFFKGNELVNYPLYAGYSDIFIIPSESMKQFSHYCACFSVINLWVEIAIPTALVLTQEKINTNKDLELKSKILWDKDVEFFADKYKYNIDLLWKENIDDIIYIHPVKLSKWDMGDNGI